MKYSGLLLIGVALLIVVLPHRAHAQDNLDPQVPKYEFRGAWIATVVNLDWPTSRTASTANQQTQLIQMLDGLKQAGINAVFFQIRPEADALYDSPYEPWSYWLTGEQGTAPDPFYDPLTFAVEEAHKRGMELHAWLNPFRSVRRVGSFDVSAEHVSETHPEWHFTINNTVTLNPGLQEVRDYIATIIADVVRRYDVDGIHFDDYFYPYPPNDINREDQATFDADPRGFNSIGAWRRDNINRFVAQVADSINTLDPTVAFGISPFGIWKNGVPAGTTGLDAYNVIFGDATAWLDAETIDYVVPQLYWRFGGGQDYGKLAPWWAEQASNRHLYTGHGVYRTTSATFSGTLFAADEVPRQIRFNRERDDIQGSVFFRAENITTFSSKGFADSLKTDLFRHPALTPPMAWKDQTPPAAPEALAFAWTGDDEVTLSWEAPPPAKREAAPRRYAVYRVRSAAAPDLDAAVTDARNLLGLTGETSFMDRPERTTDPYYYFVTAVNANSIESEASNEVVLEGRAVANEVEQPVAFALHQNYPNPFRESTEILFRLARPATVTLRVYNIVGQVVATLIDAQQHGVGLHRVRWDGTSSDRSSLGSGTYYYTLETDLWRATKGMVRIR